jgi:predicted transcriptional regulator of viral defense system
MTKLSIIQVIYEIGRLVFTTREVAGIRGASISSSVQILERLEEQGIVKKIIQGVWAVTRDKRFSPFFVIPHLFQNHRAYLSFISALHAHGVISQIPQVITVASTAHSKKIRTPVGTYLVHRISPEFFDGFDWNEGKDYLIASPEKAFVDCLYLASRKRRQYAQFPELDLSNVNYKKVMEWIEKIRDTRIRKSVALMAEKIFAKAQWTQRKARH